MTIVLPIPPRSLSPNGRKHWSKKQKTTRDARTLAAWKTKQALNGETPPKFNRYRLAFFYKTNRRRDDDNAAASCKAYRDGIADGLRIDDHTLRMASAPTLAVDAKNPRVEITLSFEP